jgi:hypothetical protein
VEGTYDGNHSIVMGLIYASLKFETESVRMNSGLSPRMEIASFTARYACKKWTGDPINCIGMQMYSLRNGRDNRCHLFNSGLYFHLLAAAQWLTTQTK